MKRAEVQLPEALYQKVEALAVELHLTVPDVLLKATEQMVQTSAKKMPKNNGPWQFPMGNHLGAFETPSEGWRLLANEDCHLNLTNCSSKFPLGQKYQY